MEPELSDEQQQDLAESLTRGVSFEQMVKSEGWKFVQAMFENRLRAFVNGLFLNPKMPLADYEQERQQLIGMKGFINSIDADIKTLADQRKNDASRSAE